jgi:hypothetical protein
MSWLTHSINNINICKKILIQYELTSTTHMRSATHTHMIPHHRNMRCNNMRTSQHKGPLTTTWQVQHANSNTSQQYVIKKNFMISLYTRVKEIIYTLWQVLCVTRGDKLFFTWFDEVDLRYETQSVPSIVQNTLSQVTNQHGHVSPTSKNKSA